MENIELADVGTWTFTHTASILDNRSVKTVAYDVTVIKCEYETDYTDAQLVTNPVTIVNNEAKVNLPYTFTFPSYRLSDDSDATSCVL